MAKTVQVTPAQVRAAQILRRHANAKHEKLEGAIEMIADARPATAEEAEPEPSAETEATTDSYGVTKEQVRSWVQQNPQWAGRFSKRDFALDAVGEFPDSFRAVLAARAANDHISFVIDPETDDVISVVIPAEMAPRWMMPLIVHHTEQAESSATEEQGRAES